MRLATLILNPVARQTRLFEEQLPLIQQYLINCGYRVNVLKTTSTPGSARALAAAAAGASTLIFACGGDGTLHGVVQGLAGTEAALGVVPLGTANALARNLGVPLDPLCAVVRLMAYQARRIPLGQISTPAGTRWFAVMAGCGPDGMLVRELSEASGDRLKARFGRMAYYVHAARLFFTRRWPEFPAKFRATDSDEWTTVDAVAVMASRVADLGGVFSGTTPLAQMTDTRLHVQLVRGPAWLSLPAWMICGRLGLWNPWLTTVDCAEVQCAGAGVYAQADAEGLGPLPMHLRAVPAVLRLLMAPDAG